MRSPAKRVRVWAGCATTWLLLALLAVPLRAQTFVPPIESALEQLGEAGETASLPQSLAEVHVYLEGKAGRELERAFRRVFRAHPQPAMDALVLRAGTAVPPGVTAARAALRQSTRDDAARLLAAEVGRSAKSRERWLTRLRYLLQGDEARRRGPALRRDRSRRRDPSLRARARGRRSPRRRGPALRRGRGGLPLRALPPALRLGRGVRGRPLAPRARCGRDRGAAVPRPSSPRSRSARGT